MKKSKRHIATRLLDKQKKLFSPLERNTDFISHVPHITNVLNVLYIKCSMQASI